VVLPRQRIQRTEGLPWAQANLRPPDAGVLEATTTAWTLDAQRVPLGGRVGVAHPAHMPATTGQRVTPDKRAGLRLARLWVAARIPARWVPPPHLRALRSLVADRRRRVNLQPMRRTRGHSVLHRANLPLPPGAPCSQRQRAWWQQRAGAPPARLRRQQALATLADLRPQILALEVERRRVSTRAPWKELAP
jgi:transposase